MSTMTGLINLRGKPAVVARWMRLATKVVVASMLVVGGTAPSLADDAAKGAVAVARLETLKSARGATTRYILLLPPKPRAALVLFAGGHGALGLTSPTEMRWGSANFLVRVRERFVEKGFAVAVIDAPSDRSSGMNAIFRMSREHTDDISAVIGKVRAQAQAPVWLVGTSMGTFSAASVALRVNDIAGLVLSSSITRAAPDWAIAQSHSRGIASLPLQNVRVPTLILAHRGDACRLTPPSDVETLRARLSASPRVEVVLLDGGLPPRSPPCEASSQHGFLGIEGQATDAIAGFIAASR